MAKWIYPKVDKKALREQSDRLGLSPVALQILKNRGVESDADIDFFLNGTLGQIHSPALMKDAEKAVQIIKEYIESGELIVVYSDYDCDGIGSAVIGVESLEKAGANVVFFTNNRFKHGYGICPSGIDDMLAMYPDAKLIITTDNGIVAYEGIQYAKDKGLTVIVTDHHEPGDMPPPADAVVNPKQKDCPYPFKGLCGAGVIFKLMMLLYWELDIPVKEVYSSLDIVALATVGDIVPLVDENRIFVREGLKQIRQGKRPVFRYLRELTNMTEINAHYTLSFVYVPMMNAIGRLNGDPREAIEMFFKEDEEEIIKSIKLLIKYNEERKDMTVLQTEQAIRMIEGKGLKHAIVVYDEDFHEGIIGLIAGRLKEKYNRPTFAFTRHGDVLKASGRSIDGFHLKEALDELIKRGIVLGGGGHEKACGLSIEIDKLKDFENAIVEMAEEQLTEEDFIPKIVVDYVLDPSEVSIDLIDELKELEPFGEGFKAPQFALEDFHVDKIWNMGKEKQHLKLVSGDLSIVAWNASNHYRELGEPMDVKAIGVPQINVWNNKVSIQFMVDNDQLLPC